MLVRHILLKGKLGDDNSIIRPPFLDFIKIKDLFLGGAGNHALPLASLELFWTTGLKMLGEDTEKRHYSYVG